MHASFYTCIDTLTTIYIYKVKKKKEKKKVLNISLSLNAKWRKLTKPFQNIPSRIWTRTTNWATTNSSCSSQSHTKTIIKNKKREKKRKEKKTSYFIFLALIPTTLSSFQYLSLCSFMVFRVCSWFVYVGGSFFLFSFLTLVFFVVWGGINMLVGLELLFCTLTKNKSMSSKQ